MSYPGLPGGGGSGSMGYSGTWNGVNSYSSQPPQHYNQGGYQQGPSQQYYNQYHNVAQPPHQHYPPSVPGYNSAPPPGPAPMDNAAVAHYMSHELQRLTFNSKPVITHLTLFAHQQAQFNAHVIAHCFEQHLDQCPPEFRLPAFYLLDSISKNIGAPYLQLFTPFIERVFVAAYRAVDPTTRVKYEELLGTWRRGASDGGELFRFPGESLKGGAVLRGIESALFGGSNQGAVEGQSHNRQTGVATPGERSGVLFDIRRLLALRQDQGLLRPDNAVNLSQINALQKLESLVLNTPLTSEQVQQIRGQLATLAPPPSQEERARSTTPLEGIGSGASVGIGGVGGVHVKPEPHSMYSHPVSVTGLSGGASNDNISHAPLAVKPPSHPSILSGQNLERAVRSLLSPGPPNVPTPTPPPPSSSSLSFAGTQGSGSGNGGSIGGIDLSLLASLQASGGLSSLLAQAQQQQQQHSRDLKPNLDGTGGEVSVAANLEGPAVTWTVEDDALTREFDQAIMNLDIKLVNRDINTWRPEAASFLAGRLQLQCTQCGLRFFDSARGKQMMDQHLDWHFTHKRRIREGAQRAQGRSWLALEEDWIHADDIELLDAAGTGLGGIGGAIDGSGTSTSMTLSAAASAKAAQLDLAALRRRHVTAPTDPGLLAKPCPVCKDRFKAEWSEEDEEWVFWNAVELEDGSIMHATCQAESAASKATSRIKLEATTGGSSTSRETTPAIVETAATDGGGAGGSAKKKRKALDDAMADLDESQAVEAGDDRGLKRPKSEPTE